MLCSRLRLAQIGVAEGEAKLLQSLLVCSWTTNSSCTKEGLQTGLFRWGNSAVFPATDNFCFAERYNFRLMMGATIKVDLIIRGKILNRRRCLLKNMTRENACQPGNQKRPWAVQLASLKCSWIPRNQSYPEIPSMQSTNPRNCTSNLSAKVKKNSLEKKENILRKEESVAAIGCSNSQTRKTVW